MVLSPKRDTISHCLSVAPEAWHNFSLLEPPYKNMEASLLKKWNNNFFHSISRLLGLTKVIEIRCSNPDTLYFTEKSTWPMYVNPALIFSLYWVMATESRRWCSGDVSTASLETDLNLLSYRDRAKLPIETVVPWPSVQWISPTQASELFINLIHYPYFVCLDPLASYWKNW